jgi:riboflavin synthase
MFTGIIERTGTILRCEPLERGLRITIGAAFAGGPPTVGESIAIDGACMTVTTASAREFSFEASAESLRKTTLGGRRVGERVNLERALTLADRIGGHLVSGHVDGTGRLLSITPEGESAVYQFEAEPAVCELVIEKGSIAVDGISLTCFHCRPERFEVAVIPHTAAVTTLGEKRPGDAVNLEADMIGKYVAKLVGPYVERGG